MNMPKKVLAALLLSGCAKSSVIPISSDTIQLTTGAAPLCGQVGARSVAATQAAVETLRRGFDKFAVLGGQYQNDTHVVGYTPIVANTSTTGTATVYGNQAFGSAYSDTVVTGGDPIVGGTHNQALLIKMFKADDPNAATAIDARSALGSDWKKIAETGVNTCL